MKKAAILIDGGFALPKLQRQLGKLPAAQDLCDFAVACLDQAEELFRIYYYDCPPFEGVKQNPLSKKSIDFSATKVCRDRKALLDRLARKDHVALRKGELSFDGWVIGQMATTDIIKTSRAVVDTDLRPNLRQKRVDMTIGLDVAWLASKRIVDRIILVAVDSDFVPAMKFARREGLQVVLVTLGHSRTKPDMFEHCDEHRNVVFTPASPAGSP
jgi:uncharacterized LabA/DUF88 family protein